MSNGEHINVVEVGPRDGLQNEPEAVPLRDKVRYICMLIDAGLPMVEVGAFVRPDLVPQMADTEDVIAALSEQVEREGTKLVALVPNKRGLQRAIASGIHSIAIFTAASEAFNRANIRMSVDESLERFEALVSDAKDAKLCVRAYLSTCWWCPFSGQVEPKKVLGVTKRLLEMGCEEVSIADTVGAATPREVRELLQLLISEVPLQKLAVHFHDTRGTALANVLAALELGISTVDTSAGGLGGCPFAPGAAGNLATEELLFMLHGMGYETGVDLDRVRAASEEMERVLGRRLPSRYLRAGPVVPRGRRNRH
jgi:hydroxymethylglutaryl-CoA lyase